MTNQSNSVLLETERLFLRELILADCKELSTILCDPVSMVYYPAPFTIQQVEDWIDWNIENYRKFHHGLWAVILKENNVFLGDCGITMQDIDGELLPELGYHVNKEYCGNGYATEAAKACMRYAFDTLGYQSLYTYTKHDNIPSRRVAEKLGMTFVKHFEKTVQGTPVHEVVYQIHTGAQHDHTER